MNNRRYQRRHHRVGEKSQQEPQGKSLIELDFTKATIFIAIVCLIQGILIGRATKN